MSVQLTPAAAKRIQSQLAKRGKGLGLRLGVKKSGCSGWAYTMDYADALAPDELVFESHGAKVIVRREHLAQLEGVVVDFARVGLNEAFRFENPKAKALCGCGESFTTA